MNEILPLLVSLSLLVVSCYGIYKVFNRKDSVTETVVIKVRDIDDVHKVSELLIADECVVAPPKGDGYIYITYADKFRTGWGYLKLPHDRFIAISIFSNGKVLRHNYSVPKPDKSKVSVLLDAYR